MVWGLVGNNTHIFHERSRTRTGGRVYCDQISRFGPGRADEIEILIIESQGVTWTVLGCRAAALRNRCDISSRSIGVFVVLHTMFYVQLNRAHLG